MSAGCGIRAPIIVSALHPTSIRARCRAGEDPVLDALFEQSQRPKREALPGVGTDVLTARRRGDSGAHEVGSRSVRGKMSVRTVKGRTPSPVWSR